MERTYGPILPRNITSNHEMNASTLWAATCVFPISGIYTRMQRLLFYVVMIFIFCLHFHEWLTAAAVGFALTYSSTAAIHAIVLSFQHEVGRDLDHLALMAITTAGGVAGVVFALYLPRVLERNARSLFVTWSCLMAAASCCLAFTSPKYVVALSRFVILIGCDEKGNNCQSPCGATESNALFRTTKDNLVPDLLGLWTDTNLTPGSGNTTLGTDAIGSRYIDTSFHNTWGIIIGGTAIGMVIRTSILNIARPPRSSRNWIFRRVTSRRSITSINGTCSLSRWQVFAASIIFRIYYVWNALCLLIWPLAVLSYILNVFYTRVKPKGRELKWFLVSFKEDPNAPRRQITAAKMIALAWYCWAQFAYLNWLFIMIFGTVMREIQLKDLPESESPQSVGQWSPWVAVGLSLMAGLLSRVRKAVRDYQESEETMRLNRQGRDHPLALVEDQEASQNRLSKLTCRWRLAVVEEWKDLCTWCRDPVTSSTEYPELRTQFTTGKGSAANNGTTCQLGCSEGTGPCKGPEDSWTDVFYNMEKSRKVPSRPPPPSKDSACQRQAWEFYVPCSCSSCEDNAAKDMQVQQHRQSISLMYADDAEMVEKDTKANTGGSKSGKESEKQIDATS
jgi:hypothetical protein